MQNGNAAFIKSEVTYVADLVEAGMQGVVSGWKGTAGRMLFSPARAIWAPAVVGAAVGVLSACLNPKRPGAGQRAAMNGLVGSALGLGVGVAWTSRAYTQAAVRGATRQVNAVRDAHWLERHPIAYA